jgi:hypothetical protein
MTDDRATPAGQAHNRRLFRAAIRLFGEDRVVHDSPLLPCPYLSVHATDRDSERIVWTQFGCVYPDETSDSMAIVTGNEVVGLNGRVYVPIAGPFKTVPALLRAMAREVAKPRPVRA